MTRKLRTAPRSAPASGPLTPQQIIEQLTRMNNNLALQIEEFTSSRMTESLSDLDWANRIDKDYLWIRASGANAPQFRYMTKETIDMYADIANFMYVYNPLINRVVTVKTSFTFALDYTITAKDPEGDIGKKINAILKDKLNRQAIFTHKAITEIDSELLRTGNVFIAVWVKNNPINISAWSNYEIRQVVTDKDNANRPLFYIRQWLDDEGKQHTKAYPSMFATDKDIPGGKMKLTYLGTDYEIDRSVVVYHVCGKKPLKAKFALTELVAPCRWAKPHEKFLEDFGAIVTAIRTYTSMMITKGGPQQVSALSAQFVSDADHYTGTGTETNPLGSMIVASEGNEYKIIDAGSGKIVGPQDSRYFLLMVSAASGVPETYLTMDPSTGNLATAKEISPVFITLIQERQTAWKEALTDIFEYILESDEFEVSFPPIRDNLQAYIDNVNKIARKPDGSWSGAVRGKDYVKAGHEALEWKLPPDEEVDAMGAAVEAGSTVEPEPPGMDAGLDAIAQAATELKEAIETQPK